MTQKELFLDIWATRKHQCGVCKEALGYEPNAWYFAHIIPKGSFRAFKLRAKNVTLLCKACHICYDHNTGEAKKLEAFNWLFSKQRLLKKQYFWYIENKLIVDSRLEAWRI